MVTLLVLLAMGALVVGCLCLSQATLGVRIIGAGCLLGILARIAQASEHQQLNLGHLASIPRILLRLELIGERIGRRIEPRKNI